jgi:chorismate mutase
MNPDPELHSLRAAMDVINTRLAAVLHERARLCRAIGEWKRSRGVTALDPTREQQMLAAVLKGAPADGFAASELTAIMESVFAASRKLVTGTCS